MHDLTLVTIIKIKMPLWIYVNKYKLFKRGEHSMHCFKISILTKTSCGVANLQNHDQTGKSKALFNLLSIYTTTWPWGYFSLHNIYAKVARISWRHARGNTKMFCHGTIWWMGTMHQVNCNRFMFISVSYIN
jgi:hypothetical protein